MPAFNFCPSCTAPLVDKVVEGETRRVCGAGCGFVHYDNPTPVVAAIVEHEGQVVLARNRAWPRTFYGLITGFLERAETPQRCVVREVKEELNLDSGAPTLVGVYAFERCRVWPGGTGLALRDWLRTKGYEPQSFELP